MLLKTFQYSSKTGWDASFHEAKNLNSKNTIVFVFGSPHLKKNEKIFQDLKNNFFQSTIVGCSGSGEIFKDHVFDESLSVAVVRLQQSSVKAVTIPIQEMSQSCAIGENLAKQLKQPDLAGVFVISDGLLVNGSELVKGINSVIPETIVTGGLAGDGDRFQKTWVLKDGFPASGFVTAIGFYGNKIHIGHGSKGGWDIFGPERIVTRSNGNILYELDGEPALNVYKEYLGDKASELPAAALLFPLQIRSHENDEKKIVRTILAVDEKQQTMTFAGNIPEGSLAQLMRANFDRLIEGASGAARLLSVQNVDAPILALAVSCVGRRLVLGERIDEEVEATLSFLPKQAQQVGFYSYGEISPYVQGQACELHNQTMTLTTLTEDDVA